MAYDFDPDLRGTILSHRDQISEALLRRSESNNKACDKVFEGHQKASGNLREIQAGIAVLNSLKAVEDERMVGSLDVWFSESEEECSSYELPSYGKGLVETGELRHQVRLLIGFLQNIEQELIAEMEHRKVTTPSRLAKGPSQMGMASQTEE